MKRLYMIGGPMGVGKTAACRQLQQLLDRSVFLDRDWCWDAHPFQVTEETREMVLENISFLLNSFLRCSAYDHVIFCWVLHRREIWEDLLRRLTEPYVLRAVSLVCTPETLGPGWREISSPESEYRMCWTGAWPTCRCMMPWTSGTWM